MALTAGHCTNSTHYNNGNYVGSTFTTAYPGNTDIYGDWKLIDGRDYAHALYSQGVSSNT